MKTSIENRVALITGASAGIGRAIAIALSAQGVHLMLCARDKGRLQATADICMQHGSKAAIFPCDLTDDESIMALIDCTKQTFGGLDILINCAGIALNQPVSDCTTKDFDDIFSINVKSTFLTCKHCIPLLEQSDAATIINISSTAGSKGYKNQALYSASKFAVSGFSQALAKELAPDIRVLLLSPGAVGTEMATAARPDLHADLLINTIDLAEIVVFALTHRSSAIIDELRVRRQTTEPFS